MAKSDAKRGLYLKYTVYRNDGSSGPGKKHDGCEYFVLDLHHDKHAMAAIRAYLLSCRKEFPALADDLRDKMMEMEQRFLPGKRSERQARARSERTAKP